MVLERDCTRHPMWSPKLPPTLKWCNCHACDHVFTEGFWTDKGLDIVFEKTQPVQQPLAQLDMQRGIAGRMIDKVRPFTPPAASWLDVGFGSGALLTTAQEYGFVCTGLDLRLDNVKAMSDQGIEAQAIRIENFDVGEKYDVISLFDVLEHVPYPVTMLQAAGQLLNENGVLVVSTPRMDCAMWDVLEHQASGNPYWAEVEHHHIFTHVRLLNLLRDHDFIQRRYAISERYLSCMEIVFGRR